MECREAEDLFVPYLLGALDPTERRLMELHLNACPTCSLRLQGDGETVAKLAFAVPQLDVPPRAKEQLLSKIGAEARPRAGSMLEGMVAIFRRPLQAHMWKLVAAGLVVVLVFGGLWFNSRLNRVSENSQHLTGQVASVVEQEAQARKMLSDQRYFTSMTAAPGVSVNMLRGTAYSTDAWGIIACCAASDAGIVALLSVMNLPALPGDKVYQVWLLKDGQRYSAGVFTVDSTGNGQTVIVPAIPFDEVEDIGITIEPAGGSAWPTGSRVLQRDL